MDENLKYLCVDFKVVPNNTVDVDLIKQLLENSMTNLCPGGLLCAEGTVLGEVTQIKANIYPKEPQ